MRVQKNSFLRCKNCLETIITNFAKGKINEIKTLLDKKVLDQFEDALKEEKKWIQIRDDIYWD